MTAGHLPGPEAADTGASGSASPHEQVALLATFTARPGCGTEVEKLLRELTRQVRQERGNIVFDPYRTVDRPERFCVYEVYADRPAFEQHLAAESGAKFNQALAGLIVEDASQLEFLRPLA